LKSTKIAIVGGSCRFPGGVNSLDEYWSILKNEVDAVTEIPDERWSKAIYGHPNKKINGRSYAWSAGVLSSIDKFDADFFGISRREAEQIDPQQRLLLELTWEALECAGIKAEDIAGSKCGVFVGISGQDYTWRSLDDLASIDAYTILGGSASICSNRISYLFDLHGPSFSLDTACSSSLVAIHQACNSIKNGESSMAIAGGVSLLIHPMGFIGFSKASMLSPTGRCRAFDAAADGYVRAEGAGIVILKELEQAKIDGDNILAIINASGINSDGRTYGISMPSAKSQAELLESIYARSEIDLNQLVYLEAHGTGTQVGDSLEAKAISDAIASRRSKRSPLLIGSAKTNLGHLETASGMAGLLKAVLCIQQRAVPSNLHFNTPNPNISFAKLNLKVVNKYTEFNETEKPLLVGVNSFGFGGTNAHVLLEEYQKKTERTVKVVKKIPPLYLSAKDPQALCDLARIYHKLLLNSKSSYYDIAWTAFHHRQQLKQRMVVYAESRDEIVRKLDLYAENKQVDSVVVAEEINANGKVALVYSGNGSQWLGMGVTLYTENSIFRRMIIKVDKHWRQLADFSIIDELFASKEKSRIELTEIAQPALFAIQVGITQMLKAMGLEFTATVGHSVGEIAAAWAAGCLSLQQAVEVIFVRSYAQSLTKGQGKMAAVALSATTMREWLKSLNLEESVVVAGINSPKSITIAGSTDALLFLKQTFHDNGVVFKMLDLDYAFHSPSMDKIKDIVIERLCKLKPIKTKKINFISTVSGKKIDGDELDAEYWWENIRLPVEFNQAVSTLIADGVTLFIEVGPHPVLSNYLEQNLKEENQNGVVIRLVRRNKESVSAITDGFYQLHLSGSRINNKILFPIVGNYEKLPLYPWQRERYWRNKSEHAHLLIDRTINHSLLGFRDYAEGFKWVNSIDLIVVPWLTDHDVGGAVVIPAAAYIEMALSAGSVYYNGNPCELEDVEIVTPIVLTKDSLKTIISKISDENGFFSVKVVSDNLNNNVSCRLLEQSHNQAAEHVAFPDFNLADVTYSAQQHYALGRAVGLNYGPAFQSVEQVWIWPQQLTAWARLGLPKILQQDPNQYLLHPSILDGCFQLLLDLFEKHIRGGDFSALIPIRIGRFRFYKQVDPAVAWCCVKIKRGNMRSTMADFVLFNSHHKVVATLNDVRFRSVSFVQQTPNVPTYKFIPKLMPLPNNIERWAGNLLDIMVGTIINKLPASTQEFNQYEHYKEVLPLFDKLTSACALEAITRLVDCKFGFSVKRLLKQKILAETQVNLFSRLLAIVAEDGLMICNHDKWFLTEEEISPSQFIWRSILADYPRYLAELTLLANSATKLVDTLKGKIDIQTITIPNKSSTWSHYLGSSPSFILQQQIILLCIKEIVDVWPKDRRLKILEVANGSNELSKVILASLPLDVCDYLLIDANEAIVNNSSAIFANMGGFKSINVDIHNLPQKLPEDLEAINFDLVIATNVLHMATHHGETVNVLRKFLGVDGLLLLGERDTGRFSDIVHGVNPNWWPSERENKKNSSRLLPASTWKKILERNGFGDTYIIQDPKDKDLINPYVILAKSDLKPGLNNEPMLICTQKLASLKTCLIWVDNSTESNLVYEELFVGLVNHGFNVIKLQPANTSKIVSEIHYNINFYDDEEADLIIDKLPNFEAVIHIGGLTILEKKLNLDTVSTRCWELIKFLQLIETRLNSEKIKFCLATKNGAVFDGSESDIFSPSASALWGLGRVIVNEYPDLTMKLLDLRNYSSKENVALAIIEEVLLDDNETEIVKSPEQRLALRMREIKLTPISRQTGKPSGGVVLDFRVAGSLNNLYWRDLPPLSELEPDEISIKPYSVGLNFRDVMYAMGMLSDEAVENGFAGSSLGMELVGRVEKVGADVTEFKAGDEVISFAPASFATRVITKTTATALKPESWNNEEAATVPTAFFTVYYALHYLARLQPGERILIHGAAGGVGLAAMQYAKIVGAEIYATAGTDEKRAFVLAMGADYVMDSRNLDFANEIMRLTSGKGVDVVLNSLYGEAVWRNLAILSPFGRFLELGKRDFYANNKIGLRPFRNNISYFGIDADQLLIERKDLARKLFKEMMGLFNEGKLTPLPYRVFAASQIEEAFRYMQQSKQIGKIVVSFKDFICPKGKFSVSIPSLKNELKLNADASYLVTGGASGFGLESAKWLVKKGAKNLILLSRSGPKDTAAKNLIRELEELGTKIYIHLVDVSDFNALDKLFFIIQKKYPELKGIIHAAAVIDDALIRNLDKEKLDRVLLPKVHGAWNLHALSAKLKLDFFVLYSSMTTFIGNPGQANYVAANCYLESLARFRHAHGLCATYAAFGPILDVGFLTKNEGVKNLLESRLGKKAMLATQALAILEKLMISGEIGAAIMDFDWHTIQRFMPGASAPKYEEQIVRAKNVGGEHQDFNIKEMVANLPRNKALELIIQSLAHEVGKIIRVPTDKIDQHKSIFDMGMDSLMGVELALAIEEHFAVKLPLMALAEGVSIAKLSSKIYAMLSADLVSNDSTHELVNPIIAKLASTDKQNPTKFELGIPIPPRKISMPAESEVPLPNGPLVRTIFLTGGTGVLGGYLIKLLLSETNITPICLLRAKSIADAKERIKEILRAYETDDKIIDSVDSRVQIILGDIAEPKLGLSEKQEMELVKTIDYVIHCAGKVSLHGVYEAIAPINVLGTKHLIDFTLKTPKKHLMYVSSYSIIGDRLFKKYSSFRECDFDLGQSFDQLGYQQTKFEGELLVRESKKQGMRWTIVRPGNIFGDSQTGCYPLLVPWLSGIFYDILKTVIHTHVAVKSEIYFDMTPVDYVARGMLYFATLHPATYGTYHLNNPTTKHYTDIIECIIKQGNSIQIVSSEQYMKHLQDKSLFFEGRPYQSKTLDLMRLNPSIILATESTRVDAEFTSSILKRAGIHCAPLDEPLIKLYLDYCKRVGYIFSEDATCYESV
jgi:phthiocerol/phenolphthiocerol synthesis type-I polyketide synthase C